MSKNVQVVLCVDVSVSMNHCVTGRTSRLDMVKEALGLIIKKICLLDPNGPDLLAFGKTVTDLGTVNTSRANEMVQQLVADEFATNIGGLLSVAFSKAREYIKQGDSCAIIVFTDGAASDSAVVEKEIVEMTKKIPDRSLCSLGFIYFGDEAKSYLDWLDKGLVAAGAAFDMVKSMGYKEALDLGPEELLNEIFNG